MKLLTLAMFAPILAMTLAADIEAHWYIKQASISSNTPGPYENLAIKFEWHQYAHVQCGKYSPACFWIPIYSSNCTGTGAGWNVCTGDPLASDPLRWRLRDLIVPASGSEPSSFALQLVGADIDEA